jgi:hypothetical protein
VRWSVTLLFFIALASSVQLFGVSALPARIEYHRVSTLVNNFFSFFSESLEALIHKAGKILVKLRSARSQNIFLKKVCFYHS